MFQADGIVVWARVPECHLSRQLYFMGSRSFKGLLPRRLRARVHYPEEIRMGSPQYGQLLLDGEPLSRQLEIEAGSLLWSGWRVARRAGLISWPDGPITRVAMFDVQQCTRTAASPSRRGRANPVNFEPDGVDYRRWHERVSDQALRLRFDGD